MKIVAACPSYAAVSSEDGKSINIINWHHLIPHLCPIIETNQKLPETIENGASIL